MTTPLLLRMFPASLALVMGLVVGTAWAQSGGGECVDQDGDGFLSCVNDCDDNNPNVHPQQQDLTCDGVDDNCNGVFDENYQIHQSECGIGACRKYGNVFCVGGSLHDTCQPQEPAADDSTCNNKDDDCDGITDEDYMPVSTSCGLGACGAQGMTQCENGVTTSTCVPGPKTGTDNDCDGVDDDCDGATDELYAGVQTSCGVGGCFKFGITQCQQGTVVDTCTPKNPAPDDSTCNQVDDDCDGITDEDFQGWQVSCGIGPCEAIAVTECVNGVTSADCTPLDKPGDDTDCNGQDDDCDGLTDEHYVVQQTSCGVGACKKYGNAICQQGSIVDTCVPHEAAEDDSVCDGKDNDCDGMTDEDHVPGQSTCGTGICAATGTTTCVNGVEVDECTPGEKLSLTDTTCDGVDDDCNGVNDEDYTITSSTCGAGACAKTGNVFCVAGELNDTCVPQNPEPDTNCDGKDDDCDGEIDEDFVPGISTCGVGACVTSGTTTCTNGVEQDICTPDAGASEDTTCDGVDDDCDGSLDEDYVVTVSSCGSGFCTGAGFIRCIDAQVIDTCEVPQGASDDATCDGIDQDCDGEVDEDFEAHATSCGTGPCASTGTATCVAGEVLDSCEAIESTQDDLNCDGIDNDCDGATDEGFIPFPTVCGEGQCGHTGNAFCVNGTLTDTCQPKEPAADDASCDGLDSDCDGAIDEDFASGISTCGVGACVNTGSTACTNGVLTDICEAQPAIVEVDASCDGIDEDCDGSVDEDFPAGPVTCGVGACASEGFVTCDAGVLMNGCTPGNPAPDDSSCDGIDNDCDGEIDEDFVSATVSCGTGACVANGFSLCVGGVELEECVPGSPQVSEDVTCDGIDQDCDGEVDEDFVLTESACGIGGCAAMGTVSCLSGHVVDDCVAGTPASGELCGDAVDNDCDGEVDDGCCIECVPGCQPTSEDDAICDGIDSDCDGEVDEDFVTGPSVCGEGVCASAGMAFCHDGVLVDTCFPGRPASTEDADCDGVDSDCDGGIDEDCVEVCVPTAMDDANCDGIDEDCDGVVDEDFAIEETTCGSQGACTAEGAIVCVNGESVDTCEAPEPAAADAQCDGVDEDCDGEIDEDFIPALVSCGEGVCASEGITSCTAGVLSSDCVPGAPLGSIDDQCDGVDDDCDGEADEDHVGDVTTCGTIGKCVGVGAWTCEEGVIVDSCEAPEPAAADTSCNGQDDDCDGEIDEDYQPQEITCGTGACLAAGTTICSEGVVLNDCAPNAPLASIDDQCDGVDDDCDGEADEDYVSTPTSCGTIGKCVDAGELICSAGAVVDTCNAPSPAAADTSCNGVDDDCDGETDEDHVPVVTACGEGVCGAIGITSCLEGVTMDSCTPGTPLAAIDDQCDGIDDDCDGKADEDFEGPLTSCGTVGKCVSTGQVTCQDGEFFDTCDAPEPAALDTLCNGIDDDCDGEVDEDYVPVETNCGQGVCASTGFTSCVDGKTLDDCAAGEPIDTMDANCDDVDDDCDGQADEDFFIGSTECGVGACGSTGDWACEGGAIVNTCAPGAPALDDSTCDGVDDDCDGSLDEDFTPELCEDCVIEPTGCLPNAGPGCDGCVCETEVCAQDGWCCDVQWDGLCVQQCDEILDGLCTTGSPDGCEAAEGPGCVDCECEAAVCDEDPYCCAVQWDAHCVTACAHDGGECELGLCGAEACPIAEPMTCAGGELLPVCVATSPEDVTCDGVDDDCDGDVDEDFGVHPSSCGLGACGASGEISCVDGAEQDSCEAGEAASDDASCNGADDDCDGEIDEDCCGLVATVSQGEWTASAPVVKTETDAAGFYAYGAVDQWSAATGHEVSDHSVSLIHVDPDGVASLVMIHDIAGDGSGGRLGLHLDGAEELTIAAADDPTHNMDSYDLESGDFSWKWSGCCTDGIALSGLEPGSCVTVTPTKINGIVGFALAGSEDGAAVLPGVEAFTICLESTCEEPCEAVADTDVTCDGVDDDCDGEVDEDVQAMPIACGVGACAAVGETVCVDGVEMALCEPGTPSASDATCDGLDDDCDGEIDEDYLVQGVKCGEGLCTRKGAILCEDGVEVDTCEPGLPSESSDESCDGLDNDCDGEVDEDHVSQQTSCGVGACSAHGALVCQAGVTVDTCEAGVPALDDMSCDGVDNDCDGGVDEDYISVATSCGVGACGAMGERVCDAGAEFDTCEPGIPASTDAVCDGIDADCDGEVDEDHVPEIVYCGTGACKARARTVCHEGEVMDHCTPGEAAEDDADCDGVDDDCDGEVDEDFTPMYTVTQGNWRQKVAPIEGETDVAAFYGYDDVNPWSADTGWELPDHSVVMLYRDSNDVLSLVMVNDAIDDGSGGRLVMNVEGLDQGTIAAQDDDGHSQDTIDLDEGYFAWKWYDCCTDGVAIENVGDDVCVTFQPTFMKNLEGFAVATGGDEPGYITVPDTSAPFTLCAATSCETPSNVIQITSM